MDQIRFTKGFVRRSTYAGGKPAFILLLVIDGEPPPELGDETVIAGRIVLQGKDASLLVEATQKTDKYAGHRIDQVACEL